MRNIDEIIIHASATRPNWMERESSKTRVNEIRKWHVVDNGWDDIGYHFIIDREGTMHLGRPEEVVGAHCRGRNAHSLGVCLVGGFGGRKDDSFETHFTNTQEQALKGVINVLTDKYGLLDVSGHNQYANKACPCFDVQEWWFNISKDIMV